jgi:hypothetical protein
MEAVDVLEDAILVTEPTKAGLARCWGSGCAHAPSQAVPSAAEQHTHKSEISPTPLCNRSTIVHGVLSQTLRACAHGEPLPSTALLLLHPPPSHPPPTSWPCCHRIHPAQLPAAGYCLA